MKDPQKHIAEEVEKTLELAENIQAARPSAFLKSRIMAQLEPVPEVNWWRKNRLAIAAAVVLLLANAVTVLQYSGGADQGQQTKGVEAIADVYDMNTGSNY